MKLSYVDKITTYNSRKRRLVSVEDAGLFSFREDNHEGIWIIQKHNPINPWPIQKTLDKTMKVDRDQSNDCLEIGTTYRFSQH